MLIIVSIFVLTTLYKSIFSAGVSKDTIKEYRSLLLYCFKLVRVFHHPPIGYTAIKLHAANWAAVRFNSSECIDPLFLLSDPINHLVESFLPRSSFSSASINLLILDWNVVWSSSSLFTSKRNPHDAYLYLSFQPISPGAGSIKYDKVTRIVTFVSASCSKISRGQGSSKKCISFILGEASPRSLIKGCIISWATYVNPFSVL